jgi:hypothetical protein
MEPPPPLPRTDPIAPANFHEWQAYSQAMMEWQQRQNATASQGQASVKPAEQGSWLGNLNPFKGGKSRRRSKRSKRSKSRRARR